MSVKLLVNMMFRILIWFSFLCLITDITNGVVLEKIGDHIKIARVTVHSTLNELNDFRPGYIYLVVENQSDSLLAIRKIDLAEHPIFIKVRPTYPGSRFLSPNETALFYPNKKPIKPGASEVYGVYVEASNQVKPGKHLLLFNIFFDGQEHGHYQAGSITVTHEIQANVFGEHEILGALQNAVSFLMFPGFIMVIVAGLTLTLIPFVPDHLKQMVPEWANGEKKADLRLWVVAITLSLLMAIWWYPFLTKHLTPYGQRDYLYGYGFSDMVMMWGFSVITGIIIVLLIWGACSSHSFYRRLLSEYKYRQTYSERDDPETILNKAINNGINNSWLKLVTLGEIEKKAFLIEKDSHDKEALWVIPLVKVIWQNNANDLYDRLNNEIADATTPLTTIIKTIRKGHLLSRQGKGLQSIEWEFKGGYIDTPQRVKKGDLKNYNKNGIATTSVFYSILNP